MRGWASAALAAALVLLAGCGGGGKKATSTAPPGPAPPLRIAGFGTLTPACSGATRAVRFMAAAPSSVFARYGGVTRRSGARFAVPRSGELVLAAPTEARTRVAWGRLGLGPNCAPRVAGVQRATQPHQGVPAGIVLLGTGGAVGAEVRLPVPEDRVTLFVGSRATRLRPIPAVRGSRWTGTLRGVRARTGQRLRVQLQILEVGQTGTGTVRVVRVAAGAD